MERRPAASARPTGTRRVILSFSKAITNTFSSYSPIFSDSRPRILPTPWVGYTTYSQTAKPFFEPAATGATAATGALATAFTGAGAAFGAMTATGFFTSIFFMPGFTEDLADDFIATFEATFLVFADCFF